MVHNFCGTKLCEESFAFIFAAGPSLKFTFDIPKPINIPSNNPKRCRPLSDVDGDGNEGRKKRRLRLQLITSRLSRPFSQPATNIVERGGSRSVLLAGKQKTVGKNVMRKAAIMNRVRIRLDAAKEFMCYELEKSKERSFLKEITGPWIRTYEPHLPPSPLGLSNYDALDLEDGMMDDDCDADGIASTPTVYSDFSIMNPDSSCGNGAESGSLLDALDGISAKDLPDKPPSPPPACGIVEALREDFEERSYFFSCAD